MLNIIRRWLVDMPDDERGSPTTDRPMRRHILPKPSVSACFSKENAGNAHLDGKRWPWLESRHHQCHQVPFPRWGHHRGRASMPNVGAMLHIKGSPDNACIFVQLIRQLQASLAFLPRIQIVRLLIAQPVGQRPPRMAQLHPCRGP